MEKNKPEVKIELQHIPEVKQVWLVNDSAGGGLMELLYNWYRLFSQEIWLPNQWLQNLVNSKARVVMTKRSSRRGRVGVWRGGQNNIGGSTTTGNSHWITGIQRPMM